MGNDVSKRSDPTKKNFHKNKKNAKSKVVAVNDSDIDVVDIDTRLRDPMKCPGGANGTVNSVHVKDKMGSSRANESGTRDGNSEGPPIFVSRLSISLRRGLSEEEQSELIVSNGGNIGMKNMEDSKEQERSANSDLEKENSAEHHNSDVKKNSDSQETNNENAHVFKCSDQVIKQSKIQTDTENDQISPVDERRSDNVNVKSDHDQSQVITDIAVEKNRELTNQEMTNKCSLEVVSLNEKTSVPDERNNNDTESTKHIAQVKQEKSHDEKQGSELLERKESKLQKLKKRLSWRSSRENLAIDISSDPNGPDAQTNSESPSATFDEITGSKKWSLGKPKEEKEKKSPSIKQKKSPKEKKDKGFFKRRGKKATEDVPKDTLSKRRSIFEDDDIQVIDCIIGEDLDLVSLSSDAKRQRNEQIKFDARIMLKMNAMNGLKQRLSSRKSKDKNLDKKNEEFNFGQASDPIQERHPSQLDHPPSPTTIALRLEALAIPDLKEEESQDHGEIDSGDRNKVFRANSVNIKPDANSSRLIATRDLAFHCYAQPSTAVRDEEHVEKKSLKNLMKKSAKNSFKKKHTKSQLKHDSPKGKKQSATSSAHQTIPIVHM